MAWTSVTLEGGLFPPDLLDSIAAGEAEGQRAADFGLDGSRRLADEIQSAFSDARLYWDAFQRRLERTRESATTITREAWVVPLLSECLGYQMVLQRASAEAGGQSYFISHRMGESEHAAPVHIVSFDEELDRRAGSARRTSHAVVQEFLNRSDALWGIVTNGRRLRLLRDSNIFTKPTYLEFDLETMIGANLFSEFALLFRLLHASRFPRGDDARDCLLERYYQQGIEQGGRVREKLRDGVEQALQVLGTAFLAHPGSEALRERLSSGAPDATAYYRQLLRLVYRFLFLMVAEERRLIFPPDVAATERHQIYTDYYSIGRLRDRAERHFASDTHADLWISLRQTFRMFRDDDVARKLDMCALDGELFGDRACRDLEPALCTNADLLRAIRHLSTFVDEQGSGRRRRGRGPRRRVNYAALDVEEFGSVYESLLDFHPKVDLQRRQFALVTGSERKQTGSYYTPPELVRELVESALVPVMEERLRGAKTKAEREAALLALRVCDPAAGSGHFLLAAARKIATELAKTRVEEEEPPPEKYREALRDVIRSCIYAVDKNPLAVDLCKVALWIEGHNAGLPLNFLDHHIKCGDSLVGVFDLKMLEEGIPDDTYKPVTGDDKAAATAIRKRNRQERTGQTALVEVSGIDGRGEFAETFSKLAATDERTPEEVHRKEELYERIRGRGTAWWQLKTACDLWTYAFFAPLRNGARVPTTDTVRRYLLQPNAADAQLVGDAVAFSEKQRFFHWPLEFPDVMQLKRGFDVVLGNPPWEIMQPEEQTFFTLRDRDIAEAAGARRKALIEALPRAHPELWGEWTEYKRSVESAALFSRASGRFPRTSYGKMNLYATFAELDTVLINTSGRVGVIVQSGIATDDSNKHFFESIAFGGRIASLFDFENREGIFPGIDSRIKFCLLTLRGASDGDAAPAEFAFFCTDVAHIRDPERRFTLAPADFALFNPNTRTAPTFRSRRDAEIAAKLYRRAGVFVRESRDDEPEDNPWGVSLQQMINMTSDSHLFRNAAELRADGFALEGNVFRHGDGRTYLPLYEAKLFHQYDHRFATFDGVSEDDRKKGNARELTPAEKRDPRRLVIPRYWVPAEEVAARLAPAGAPADAEREREREYSLNSRLASGVSQDHERDKRANSSVRHDSNVRPERLVDDDLGWLLVFRDIARATDERTAIVTVIEATAVSNKAPLVGQLGNGWLQAFRKITRATDERTTIVAGSGVSGFSDSTTLLHIDPVAAAASLLLANLDSIVLDWAARFSVGGVNMNFFIVKQLPVLPPQYFLEPSPLGCTYAELLVPRVLELTYTADDLAPFARDLGYDGPPYAWDEDRRLQLRCEIDAIIAHVYQLERPDLEWILDAQPPSESFRGLKEKEIKRWGEYRTMRLVLESYDLLAAGKPLPSEGDGS